MCPHNYQSSAAADFSPVFVDARNLIFSCENLPKVLFFLRMGTSTTCVSGNVFWSAMNILAIGMTGKIISNRIHPNHRSEMDVIVQRKTSYPFLSVGRLSCVERGLSDSQ